MRAVGRVVWTGHSSMDILIEVIQHGSPSLKAVFTFVARHPETHKAHAINPLVLETDEQKR